MRGSDHLAVERPSTRSVRERIPNFDCMEAAWDELMAGKPVTQRTVDTRQPIFIIIVPHFRAAYVRDAMGRVLSRTSLAPDSPVLKLRAGMTLDAQTSYCSVFQDPETGERLEWPTVLRHSGPRPGAAEQGLAEGSARETSYLRPRRVA